MQQAAVLLLANLVFDQASLLEVDLVGELQAAGCGYCPHRAAGRGESGHDLIEHRVVKLGRSDIRPRQLRDFLDKPLDFALSAFDLLGIYRARTLAA
jgi:hypothetical protein